MQWGREINVKFAGLNGIYFIYSIANCEKDNDSLNTKVNELVKSLQLVVAVKV